MRQIWTRRTGLMTLVFMTAGILGAVSTAAGADAQQYTASNIWVEQPTRVYSTNYKKGYILAAGTAVKNVRTSKKALTFIDAETDIEYTIAFVTKHHPGKSAVAVFDRILTEKTIEQLTEGFDEMEKGAIETGSVEVGMSKEAVLVSQGYPPEVGTPSAKAPVWKYWRHRFATFGVTFDKEGRVKNVQ